MTRVIMFTQQFCAPCRRLAPWLEDVCKELNVPLEKIDVSEDWSIAQENNVTSTPAVFVDRNGTLTAVDVSTKLVMSETIKDVLER